MGKGSKRRQENFKETQNNWDLIDWNSKPNKTPTIFRLKKGYAELEDSILPGVCPKCGEYYCSHI